MPNSLPELAVPVVAGLTAGGVRLFVAESLTGGMIADALVSVPGASKVLVAGVVAYDDAAKAQILGVPAQILADFGAVSEQTAQAMAAGARRLVALDGVSDSRVVAIATTGVAGPDLQEGKPVGQVHIAFATDAVTTVKTFRFDGERASVRYQAAVAALELLLEEMAN